MTDAASRVGVGGRGKARVLAPLLGHVDPSRLTGRPQPSHGWRWAPEAASLLCAFPCCGSFFLPFPSRSPLFFPLLVCFSSPFLFSPLVSLCSPFPPPQSSPPTSAAPHALLRAAWALIANSTARNQGQASLVPHRVAQLQSACCLFPGVSFFFFPGVSYSGSRPRGDP